MRALDRAGARASLARCAADRIHDDLVTPRCTPGWVEWWCRARPGATRSHRMSRNKDHHSTQASTHSAEIVREFGPFPDAERIHGITHDGRSVWAATGAKLLAFDPDTGEVTRTIER